MRAERWCNVCYATVAEPDDDLCFDCREHVEQWKAMTPEERAETLRLLREYQPEVEGI